MGDPPAPVPSASMDLRYLVDSDSNEPAGQQRTGDPPDLPAAANLADTKPPERSSEGSGDDNKVPSAASNPNEVAAQRGQGTARALSTDQQARYQNATLEQQPDPPPPSQPLTEATSPPPPPPPPPSMATVISDRDPAQSDHDTAAPSSSSGPAAGLGLPPLGSDSASVNAPSSFSVDLSIDTDSSDADSAMGSFRSQPSSMSASSSIFDFVEEHGRTWHRYKEGKYFMPNDITEQERLELQHSISLRLLGALYLAPIERPHRVLDIGTGTGIWAIDFANEHPESDVLGTDLSPIQPEYVPPNCRFEVDDAEDEWVFNYKFDFIHSRYMSGSFGDFPAIFSMCYQNLNPGGWIEFQDYVVKLKAVDDSLRGTALERWSDMVIEGVRRMGKNANACLKYKRQMQEAGFVDVQESRFALPGNPWAKGEDQKILGTMQMENILDGLHGFSIGLFTKMLGMSAQEVELMLIDVRKDLRNTKIHFYYMVYSVYGRKPL